MSQPKQRNQTTRRLQLETMEPRRLMAGDLQAAGTPGFSLRTPYANDGVTIVPFYRGVGNKVYFNVDNAINDSHPLFRGHIDYNHNGVWDDSTFSEERLRGSGWCHHGDNVIDFEVPRNAPLGLASARFRLSGLYNWTDPNVPGAGIGETEDYYVLILNSLPTAYPAGIQYASFSVAQGGSVALNAASSADPDGFITSYQWDLDGDGLFGESGSGATRGQENVQHPTFIATGLAAGADSCTVQLRVIDNDGGVSVSQSLQIRIDQENAAPAISGLGSVVTFTEGQAPAMISSGAQISDADSANFAGGQLIVVTTNAAKGDMLRLRNFGTGAGQIGVVGANVTYQGTVIGSWSGGNRGTPLVVALNASADLSAVQALVRAVNFRATGDAPSTFGRTVSFALSDGDGGTSNSATTAVGVAAVNDEPVLGGIGGIGGSAGFTRGGASLLVAPGGTVIDADRADFAGGKLTVEITAGADANNRLRIGGKGFSVAADGSVKRSGVTIGTINANGGTGATRMEITFNSNARAGYVQQLLRSISFRTWGANTTQRALSLTLSDGDGGAATASSLVHIA